MGMKSLRDWLDWAKEKQVAIGHFNVSDSEGFKAVTEAAEELGVPVIIGVSEKERTFLGVAEIRALVSVKQSEGKPVYLNADHTYSVEAAREAVDHKYDSVIIDGAEKPFVENVMMTKEVVEYVRGRTLGTDSQGSTSGRILVEGELGFIGQGSTLLDEVPDGVSEATQTTPEDAIRFIEETGVDLFAPSVGNIHGLIRTGEPKLNIERIAQIAEAVKIPLVLHGASGNTDEEITEAIKVGIRIVHINTELRLAYREGLKKNLASTDELAPYKFMAEGVEEMKKLVIHKLKVFNGLTQ